MVKKKKGGRFSGLFFLAVVVIGLAVAIFLVRQPQRFNPRAASNDPLANTYTTATTTVTPQPTVTSPNGGEVWQRGKTYQITWNQTDVAPGQTGLFLYTRSGSTDTYLGAIAYGVSNKAGANSYSWTIGTNPPNGNNIIVQVGLYDSANKLISSDKSNNPFTVVSP